MANSGKPTLWGVPLSEALRQALGVMATPSPPRPQHFPVAIFNRNEPALYCVPAKSYAALMDKLEDMELNAIEDTRKGQRVVEVKLAEQLANQRAPASKLSGHKNPYKIKRCSGSYRVVYEARDSEVIVIDVALGRREWNAANKTASKR